MSQLTMKNVTAIVHVFNAIPFGKGKAALGDAVKATVNYIVDSELQASRPQPKPKVVTPPPVARVKTPKELFPNSKFSDETLWHISQGRKIAAVRQMRDEWPLSPSTFSLMAAKKKIEDSEEWKHYYSG